MPSNRETDVILSLIFLRLNHKCKKYSSKLAFYLEENQLEWPVKQIFTANYAQIKYFLLIYFKLVSILKDLNGAHIIKCHKILKSKSHIYLVYDFCSKKMLEDLISKSESMLSKNKKIDLHALLKLQ